MSCAKEVEDPMVALERRMLELESGVSGFQEEEREAAVAEEEEEEDTFTAEIDNIMNGRLYDDKISEKELMEKYPVYFSLPNKELVAETAYPDGKTEYSNTEIHITRWRSNQSNIPHSIKKISTNNPSSLIIQNNFFEYNSLSGYSSWYPNFAHQCLFTAWDSALLAQDELQVLEFPCLAALHSFLPSHGSLTVDSISPSPVLIQNAIRRCALDTISLPSIYGNQFRLASKELILNRLTILNPIIKSNIYAMEAPSSGYGYYKKYQILSILSTAYTAFSNIVQMENEKYKNNNGNNSSNNENNMKKKKKKNSNESNNSVIPVEIHIGYWGCGAYGGNSVLMILIQLLALKLSNVSNVVIHGSPNVSYAEKAIDIFENDIPLNNTEDAINWIEKQKFKWGVSDGN